MDWEYLDRQLKKVYHKKTISLDDKQTLQTLQKIINSPIPIYPARGDPEGYRNDF
jgi:hypothetical protein